MRHAHPLAKLVPLAGAAWLASSLVAAPVGAQVSGGSASLNAPSSEVLVSDAAAWADNLSADHNQAIFKDLAKQFKTGAAADLKLANQLRILAANSKMSPELRKQGIQQAMQAYASKVSADKSAALSEKVARVLKRLNWFSTAFKAGGYLAEGDFTGAKAVVVQEVAKNALSGTGALAGSWLPGGQFVGAQAGEYVHEAYVQKAIDSYEAAARNSAYADKYLGKPWLRPQWILDRDGTVRELPIDQYMGKDGVIRTRDATEQKVFEDGMHIAWFNDQKWRQVESSFAAGKLSPEQYSQLRAQWAMRNRDTRWNPLGAGNCDDASNDPAVKEMLQIAQRLDAMGKSIQAGVGKAGDAGDTAVLRSVGQADDMMAQATRLQTLNTQVVAKYSKECLQGIAVAAGLAPAPAASPAISSPALAANGSGTVFNKDGSRDVMVTGKDADGKAVKVWTTYSKEGRVTATRIER